MNSFLIAFIVLPAIEIFLMIKIGSKIGALTTISLIFLTAIIGLYFARIEGMRTIKSGILNMYQNKMPVFEMISGASIAVAVLLLIIPGFLTDFLGFLFLIPVTRKILISFLIRKKNKVHQENTNILDGEIIENKDNKDEL
jgi:UPF0716 protein FxsA